jgi:hypothetical protein
LTECNLVGIELVHLSHLWYGYPHGEVSRPSRLTNILSVECIIGSLLKNTTLTLTTFGFRFNLKQAFVDLMAWLYKWLHDVVVGMD